LFIAENTDLETKGFGVFALYATLNQPHNKHEPTEKNPN